MSQYPLCERYGLKVMNRIQEVDRPMHTIYLGDVIKASEVENLLSSGVEVFGQADATEKGDTQDMRLSKKRVDNRQYGDTYSDRYHDTHSGLLIGYKPIEKEQPDLAKELTDILALSTQPFFPRNTIEHKLKDLINRIQKAGVK